MESHPEPGRGWRFPIFAAMMLIAAVALGFTLLRWNRDAIAHARAAPVMVLGLSVVEGPQSRAGKAVADVFMVLDCSAIVALPLTFIAFVLDLAAAHAPRRSRLIQPGAAGCVAVMAVWAGQCVHRTLVFTLDMLTWSGGANPLPSPPFVQVSTPLGGSPVLDPLGIWLDFGGRREIGEIGMAVGVVWLILALSKNWTRERTWHDRLCRVIGFSWIAGWVLSSVARVLIGYLM